MRAAIQLAGAGLVAALLIFGCSSSDSEVANAGGAAGAASTAGTASARETGSGGIEDRAGAGGNAGVAGMSGAGGHLSVDNDDNAGAGGACAGNYLCPAVGYGSRATITFDLPITVTAAADAVFTACRNAECHTAKGSATAIPNKPEWGWASEVDGADIYLDFDDSGSTPFGVLAWNFILDFETIPSDHYSLTVQAAGAAAPTTIFDTQVSYMTVVDDPSLVSEGFCHHCSEISLAELDLRKAK